MSSAPLPDAAKFLPLKALQGLVRSSDVSSRNVLEALDARISERDGATGAYLGRDLPRALAEAEMADLSLPLGGLPIAIKDNIHVRGSECSCGSRMLAGKYFAPYNATVITKLRAFGAIPFGRTNLDEFAMGSATENSALQRTVNPHDRTRIPGGSSGGSAAAVADGTAWAALGSDTGGSIRQPASHCGIVGLKPSYGRVSRYGLVAFASSLDQIGPMTRSVADAAALLQAIAGHDPLDSTSLSDAVPDFSNRLGRGVEGLRIGLPVEYFGHGIHPGVRAQVEASIARLEEMGAELVEISLPHTHHAVATYYVIAPAEASSNLSRFDGIRYGRRSENAEDILETYRISREEGLGPEVKRRIILGTFVLSSGYHDAYYGKAQHARRLIRRDFNEAFAQVDAIVSPVTPTPARRIGLAEENLLEEYLSDVFTLGANLAGLCAISVPCGTTAFDGAAALPVGLQIIAPALAEDLLLQVAAAVESSQPLSAEASP